MTKTQDIQDARLDALNQWLVGVLGPHVRATHPLSRDASFRRYFRVQDCAQSRIVMDAPPEWERPADFVRIAGCLEQLGLTAPHVLAADIGAGFLLLDDLGELTFSRALQAGESEEHLYTLAVDTLVQLQSGWCSTQGLEGPPEYDMEELLREARLLVEWYWPQVSGTPCPDSVQEAFEAAWHETLAPVLKDDNVLVLRDFHVDNLMVLPDRAGVAACGLLDFQDALLGNPAYDLVSLLRDARRDVPDPLARRMLNRFMENRSGLDPKTFEAAYWILGAQRSTKIIGIFTRLWQRDNKPDYLSHLPRLWRLLGEELAHPALAPVRGWYDTHLPPRMRLPLEV